MKPYIVCLAIFIGMCIGYKLAQDHYLKLMLEQAEQYKASIQAIRAKEQEWKLKADEVEAHYKEELEAVKLDSSAELDRLRKQLRNTNRVSSTTNTTSKLNDPDREAKLSERILKLTEFAERCSRRTDELIIQVNNLQSWIKQTH